MSRESVERFGHLQLRSTYMQASTLIKLREKVSLSTNSLSKDSKDSPSSAMFAFWGKQRVTPVAFTCGRTNGSCWLLLLLLGFLTAVGILWVALPPPSGFCRPLFPYSITVVLNNLISNFLPIHHVPTPEHIFNSGLHSPCPLSVALSS